MKIIEDAPKWSIQEYCTGKGHDECGCGALLEIEKDDIYQTKKKRYDGDGDPYDEIHYSFTCPICHEESDIQGKIPLRIIYYIGKYGKRKIKERNQ